MTIQEAQRELRSTYLGGFAGAFVAGALWLVSGALATWGSRRTGILALVFGGMLIYPLTVLLLKTMGRSTKLTPGNTLDQLATQVAFTVPLSLPLVFAATAHRTEWFYPAMMLVVGVHYLPFVFLYGMAVYAVLAGLLIVGALALAHLPGAGFASGAWATGALFVSFAFVLRAAASAGESRRTA